MCGTVGLFTGCPAALTVCPKKLATGLSEPSASAVLGSRADEPIYRSPFDTWYERATVRSGSRRILDAGDKNLLAFPPELVPVASHPLIAARPPDVLRQVLARQAYRYLDFTAQLELLVVNRTVAGIARGSVGIDLPDEMRFDAYKIYCDEAYHALFSADLIQQLSARTGIAPQPAQTPYFLKRLDQLQEDVETALRPLVELLFVICSETLISATLAELPDDAAVVPAIRASVRDHARDEGRHHAYFAYFLRFLWAQLDPRLRQFAGRQVPGLIEAFVSPDLASVRQELLSYGMCKDEVEQVLADWVASHLRCNSNTGVGS